MRGKYLFSHEVGRERRKEFQREKRLEMGQREVKV